MKKKLKNRIKRKLKRAVKYTIKAIKLCIFSIVFLFGILPLLLIISAILSDVSKYIPVEHITTKAVEPELCKMVQNYDIQYISTEAISLKKIKPRFPQQRFEGISRYHKSIDIYNNNSPIEFIEFETNISDDCDKSTHNINNIYPIISCYSGLRFFKYNNQIYASVTSWSPYDEILYSVLKWNSKNTMPETICEFEFKTSITYPENGRPRNL